MSRTSLEYGKHYPIPSLLISPILKKIPDMEEGSQVDESLDMELDLYQLEKD